MTLSYFKMRLNVVLKIFSVFALFSFFFVSFLQRSVYNSDFWWHLATGRYIIENKSLPQSDPFSYTANEIPSKRKSMILKGNWLAETIFYKVYSFWNLGGIIFLRSLLMLLFLFFIFLTIKKQSISDFLALIVVIGVFILSRNYLGERPQLFTFFFFSLILYLLEDFRKSKSIKLFLIPFIMLILSNMHPGYIVCILLISLYLTGIAILYFLKKEPDNKTFKRLIVVWISTIIFALFNPNGLDAFKEIFYLEKYTEGIIEFAPTFSLYIKKIKPLDYSYIIFLIFSLLAIRYIRKIGLIKMLLLIIFMVMSFLSIRYVIFYMCVSAPIIARIIMNIKEEEPLRGFLKIFRLRESFLYLITSFIGAILILYTIPPLAKSKFREDTFFAVPKGAADFLNNQKIYGNMFNEYGFGGYLIWRLYPHKKVFIDGRQLELDVFEDYKNIVSAISEKNMLWEDILKKYNITYIVTPPLLPQGEIYPLVERLCDSENWVLIYSDQLSLIFLRRSNENTSIIKIFTKDKTEGFHTIIVQASARAMKNTSNPYYFITLGKVFLKMGRVDDAEKAFSIAYQRDPDNLIVKEWLYKVRENKR